ncbi:GNAT family N-acetyltransferase [Salinibacterium sp. G-O1]|uniref:GNAT family N-acetyltransferase n=1 Tax=Salinibacterium sp. G-O1 TaxID=3046208 RepID=UPI0024BB2A2E|nr:GNAT family N-acetyltransferase [Salinibacterium sp. G-O1]MDJ0334626.1 GNAT family N-acetyltransferase [Salinibacterium sp. G-O1]
MLEEEYQPRRQLPPHLRPAPVREAPFSFTLRTAELGDLPSIREIYNHYVLNSSITFDNVPWTFPVLRKKFEDVTQRGFPFIVAVSPGGQLLGFAYVYPWKAKAAYRFSVENHIYLGPASAGKGLGKAMMAELIARSRAAGVREIIAVIADKNADASIAMHEKLGFRVVGHMGRVGFKFDRWLGTVTMRLALRK